MKKLSFFGALIFSAALLFTGCSNSSGGDSPSNEENTPVIDNSNCKPFEAQLPAKRGIDEFAGKKLAGENYLDLDFNNDSTITQYYCESYYDFSTYTSTIKRYPETLYNYSYNSNKKLFYRAKKGFYYLNEDKLYTDIDEWIHDSQFSSLTFAPEYINLYKQYIERLSKSVDTYKYDIKENQDAIYLYPLITDTNLNALPVSLVFSTPETIVSPYNINYSLSIRSGRMNYTIDSNNYNLKNNITGEAFITDITEDSAILNFLGSDYTISDYDISVIGTAKLSYKITKESDTKASMTITISDFDETVKKYFENHASSEFFNLFQAETTLQLNGEPDIYHILNTTYYVEDSSVDAFNTPLPACVGIDELAGKTIKYSDTYTFNTDKTVSRMSYTITEYELSHVYEYSYDSTKKFLYLAIRSLYYRGKRYSNIKDYVNAWTHPVDECEYYSKGAIDLFTKMNERYVKSVQIYKYSINEADNTVTLTPVINSTNLAELSLTAYFLDNNLQLSLTDSGSSEQLEISVSAGLYPSQLTFFIHYDNSNRYFTYFVNARITDITDNSGLLTFVSDNNKTVIPDYSIVGTAKFTYAMNKESDTEGSVKFHISDFDDNLKQYFKHIFNDNFENKDYATAFMNYLGTDIELQSNGPVEYTIQ